MGVQVRASSNTRVNLYPDNPTLSHADTGTQSYHDTLTM
jgi:hypothetical protein